jgi:hypothetical protein
MPGPSVPRPAPPRAATGRLFVGVDKVVETIDTRPRLQPATTQADHPVIYLGVVSEAAT